MLTRQLGHKPPDRNGREPGARQALAQSVTLWKVKSGSGLLWNVLQRPAAQGGPGNREKPM